MTYRAVIGLLLAGWVFAAVAGFGAGIAQEEPSVAYRVRVKGLPFGELRTAVRAQSLSVSLMDSPPATVRQLQRRAENDLGPMTAVLRAAGYLDAVVTLEVDAERSPVRVTYRAIKGPRYVIGAFRVVYTNSVEGVPSFSFSLGLKNNQPAAVGNVERAESAALRFLRERGYPSPQKVGRNVHRDPGEHSVKVVTTIDPGAPATLGKAVVQGLNRVKPGYVRRRVEWTPGDRYDIRKLEAVEKDLLRSGVFLSARVAVSNAVDSAGDLPVRVSLVERARRTARAGVSYYSDEGLGGETSWENRNLRGGAESLSFALFGSEIKYGARGRFMRPDFTARDVDLHLELDASDEFPDAYESRKARFAALLEKRMKNTLTVSGGLAYELDVVEEGDDSTHHGFVSAPLSGGWDLRDDKLDPSRGMALFVTTTPYEDVFSDLTFIKSLGEGSVYFRLVRSPTVVLAARGSLGTITGAARDDVPADKRFYAGGGGTIRGYPYQSVGELEDGDPVGGNGLALVSSELRARLTGTLGAALFIDGGTAYSDSSPDSGTSFLWGAGVGVRYYMGFAPLRVDVAFPLQRRAEVDDAFQFYVSLGQSF